MLQWVTLLYVLGVVGTTSASDLRALCDEAENSALPQVRTFCSSLQTFLNSQGVYEDGPWHEPATKKFMRFGRDTDSLQHHLAGRQRRGGNYIRFGRSVPSGGQPSLNDYLLSFGETDSNPSLDMHRYGRSVEPPVSAVVQDEGADDKRFMRFGKKDSPSGMYFGIRHKKDSGAEDEGDDEKRFMRFGRTFMRFGRDGEDEDEKRFMRFGRGGDEEEEEKRFMRFGRGSDDEEASKRYMRFGKRFMRFGRPDDLAEQEIKRFMRFGRDPQDLSEEDKRFMRFGRIPMEEEEKRFMRFGKSDGTDIPGDLDALDGPGNKRYMRFGKRGDDMEEAEKRGFMRFGKRFMRFGKKDDDLMDEEKRIRLRFGKKSDEAGSEDEKRYMRFGKKDSPPSDEADKRYMRFGKRDTESQEHNSNSEE